MLHQTHFTKQNNTAYSGVLISRTRSTVLTAAQSGRVFVSEGHVRLIKRLGCGAVCSFITTDMQTEQLLTFSSKSLAANIERTKPKQRV